MTCKNKINKKEKKVNESCKSGNMAPDSQAKSLFDAKTSKKKNKSNNKIHTSKRDIKGQNSNKPGIENHTKEMFAEAAIRESEMRFRNLFSNMTEGFALHEIICDDNGIPADYRFLDINPAFEKINGLKKENIIGKTHNEIFPEENRFRIEIYGTVALTGEPAQFSEYSTLLDRYYEVFVYSPAKYYFAVLFIDISERKKYEHAMTVAHFEAMDEKNRLEAIMQTLPAGVAILDRNGGKIKSNLMFDKIWGLSPSKPEYETYKAWWSETGNTVKPAEYASAVAIKSGKAVLGQEMKIERPDGSMTFVLNSASPVYDACGQLSGCAVAITDITELKNREKELIRLNRTLKALSNSSQTMIRATNESVYLKEVCNIIVQDCGYAMTWIGFTGEDVAKKVSIAVHSGSEEGYLKKLHVTCDNSETGCYPTGIAIRERRPVICNNVLTDVNFSLWRKDAIRNNYLSLIAFPLASNGNVFGAITIYSRKQEAFSEDEVNLLSKLSNDIAYGIVALRLRIENAKSEERIRRSEKKFRSLAENAPDLIMRINSSFRFTYVNPEIINVCGISPEKFIGKTLENIKAPESLKKVWNDAYKYVLNTKNIKEIEFEYSGPAGKRIYDSRLVPEFAENGSVESFLSISRDVTEERKIRQELIGTQNYLHKLLNYANAPVIVWNSNLKITRFNHAFERLTGHKAIEILGKEVDMLFPQDTRKETLARIRQTIEGEQWDVVEIPVLTKDNRVRIIMWNSANIYAEDTVTYVATIAQGQDITDRKQAAAELEAIASFPKEDPYPVMRISKDGILQFANASSHSMLQAWNCNIGEPLPEGVREFAALALYSERNLEIELLTPNDRIFLTTFAPIVNAGYVNIYAMDITNRKKAENEVIKAKEELEERVTARTKQLRALAIELTQVEQREKKRLAALLHDNLQQLLVGAKWGIQTAQKKIDDKAVRESLARTGELLDESIKASKSLVVELSPPILHEEGLVAAIKWLGRWMKENNDLDIIINSDVEIESDSEDICIILFQSVRELLLNVIKHSGINTASVSVSLSENNEVKVTVSDEGAGFNYTEHKAQSTETGFGLFSIRERMALVGGQMSIESNIGIGTTVSLIVQYPGGVINKRKGQKKQKFMVHSDSEDRKILIKEQLNSKIRVLVADDHSIVREGLCGMLKSVPDIEVVGEAYNGLNAVEMTRQLHPNVVIMDVNMPVMNGIEATRLITSEMPDVKVIGLSMHEEADRASAMLKAGAVDYVHKAGPSQDLIASIKAHYWIF